MSSGNNSGFPPPDTWGTRLAPPDGLNDRPIYSASAQTRGDSPSPNSSTCTMFGLQQTGQSSTYCCSSPCERSTGTTIRSPQVGQTYAPSSAARPRLDLRRFIPDSLSQASLTTRAPPPLPLPPQHREDVLAPPPALQPEVLDEMSLLPEPAPPEQRRRRHVLGVRHRRHPVLAQHAEHESEHSLHRFRGVPAPLVGGRQGDADL